VPGTCATGPVAEAWSPRRFDSAKGITRPKRGGMTIVAVFIFRFRSPSTSRPEPSVGKASWYATGRTGVFCGLTCSM
jgi:hypothetical protein